MEQIKRDKNIRLEDGRAAVLSTVRLPGGKFETMLYTNDPARDEIARYQYDTREDALFWFPEIRKQYHVPELTGRYKKLSEDLKAAIAYGLEHMGMDDGGTSNFDAPTIRLPGWDEKKVGAAARAAGSGCFVWDLWGSKSYVFSIRGAGQGYTRTNAAEAARDYLKSLGYDAGMYYQMD